MAHKLKIFRAIIKSIAILMMDILISAQLSPKQSFHYQSMLLDSFPFGFAENTISLRNPSGTIRRPLSYACIAISFPSFIMQVTPSSLHAFPLASLNDAKCSPMEMFERNVRVAVSAYPKIMYATQTGFLGVDRTLAT